MDNGGRENLQRRKASAIGIDIIERAIKQLNYLSPKKVSKCIKRKNNIIAYL